MFHSRIWRSLHYLLPLLKSGKHPVLVTSYRPISLTFTLGKLYEKPIAPRLTWELKSQHMFWPEQCGFRSGRFTIDQVMHLQLHIHQCFWGKQHMLAIFPNLALTFDTTWCYKIVETLYDCQFREPILISIANFLSNRLFNVCIGDHLFAESSLEKTEPTGVVISPSNTSMPSQFIFIHESVNCGHINTIWALLPAAVTSPFSNFAVLSQQSLSLIDILSSFFANFSNFFSKIYSEFQ